MDQKTNGVDLYGDTGPLGLKQMLPECFVRVKLETYEDTSCSEPQQYSPSYTKPKSPPKDTVLDQQPITNDCSPQLNSDNLGFSKEPFQVLYQVQLPSHTMQQAQASNQPRSSLAASQGNQINHGPEASHVPQANSSVNRPTNQQPSQASGSHQFPHSRPSEITWLSHPYVDQNTQHFHTHQMQYVPNDAGLLSTLPGTQDGARLVKQNPESQGGSSAVGCRGDSNAGNIASVPGNDSGDSNAFISYVLSPQRGVPSSGIFLFDASRGLSSQSTQIQSTNREDGSQIDVQSSRSIDETVRESSSDSANTSGSTKSGESHLVSRSCQTIVTMSQIQDAPLLSDTKIIITGTPAPELASEPEDSKDKVFAEVDGEESEEASSMDSEGECENLKQVTRLSSDCPGFRNRSSFSPERGIQNCHGPQNHACISNGDGDQHNGIEGVCEVTLSPGSSALNGNVSSARRRANETEIVGCSNLPFSGSDRPYRCNICGNTYSSQQALVNHERYHRGERPYECEVCHKAFATNSHLVTHRRTHTGERPFQCQLCQRCFADRSAFVKHERTHGPNGSIIKRYKCNECGSGFVDSCGLKKHIRIHTGERPYVCSVCSKTFSTSSTFVAHKRIHTGERPYKCESCDKMFITKSHLLTHRRTHTGEKPFTCSVCHRCFTDGSSFRRHERLHTGENRHICMQCGRGFPLESSLLKHKQTHIQSSTFSYVYENRNDLNCIASPSQQPQDNCDASSDPAVRVSIPHVGENTDRGICVDLSREIPGEVVVNRNNLCTDAPRDIDCDNQSAHSTVRVVG